MSIPRYKMVFQSLLNRIREGEFPPGAMIPKESDLILEYGVSRITVIHAIRELQLLGLLTRVKGHGTFVREQPVQSRVEPRVQPRLINVIFPQGEQNGAHEMLMGIERICSDRGFMVTIHNTRNSGRRERFLLETALEQRPVGVILYPTGESDANTDVVSRFLVQGLPLVLVDRRLPYLDLPLVACDNQEGGTLLARHLIDGGRRRIAFVGHSLEHYSSERERYEGYCRALIGSGIPLDQELVKMIKPRSQGSSYNEEELDATLGAIEALQADAIFAVNDLLAIALLRRLQSRGKAVPADIALVGFDDIEVSSHLTPALTTLRQPFQEIGVRAAERLLAHFEGTETSTLDLRVPGELIVRRSS